ncbi:MAG: hypothetical protein LBB53_00650 [Prevotellaceae bacterium]|jgi:hypothetical protein|nr:hypothetical protein [Prevotellaceae bacterium]
MDEKREMNLFELLIACNRGVKRFFCGCVNIGCNILRISIQYFWITIIVLGAFIFWGLHSTHPAKQIYRGRTVIQFAPEAKMLIESALNGLNTLSAFDKAQFADKLNISVAEAMPLRCFETFYVIDCKNDSIPDVIDYKRIKIVPADTTNPAMSDRLALQIQLIGSNNFYPFLNGLKYFFSNQQNIVRVDSMSKAVLKERIAFCDRELDRLDRLAEYDYFVGGVRQTISNDYKRGIIFEFSRKNLYYVNMRDLLREKNYLVSIAASNPDVVNYSSEFVNIVPSPRYLYVVLWWVSGFIASSILALAFKRRKQIWNFLKNKDY